MNEPKTIQDADKPLIENDGHRRIAESVDTTRTPLEEIEDAKRNRKDGKPLYGGTK